MALAALGGASLRLFRRKK
ncbi:MAG TPA: hypothetical protein DCQ92_00845 [Verrucomicrobia subdivision 3 bacterium]|nr:hypothetical protein [Limisphaerales bacterium]